MIFKVTFVFLRILSKAYDDTHYFVAPGLIALPSLTVKPKLPCSIALIANHRFPKPRTFKNFLCK